LKAKIFLLTTANILAVIIILFFLDYFGVSDLYSTISNSISGLFTAAKTERSDESIKLLERDELEKVYESFRMREADLQEKATNLNTLAEKLAKEKTMLEQEKKSLENTRESFEQSKKDHRSREQMVLNLANKFANMPPEKAVERILELDNDVLILDVMDGIDEVMAEKGQNSIVPYLYSLMPKEDASRLMKKSTVTD